MQSRASELNTLRRLEDAEHFPYWVIFPNKAGLYVDFTAKAELPDTHGTKCRGRGRRSRWGVRRIEECSLLGTEEEAGHCLAWNPKGKVAALAPDEYRQQWQAPDSASSASPPVSHALEALSTAINPTDVSPSAGVS